jgi:flavin reductase (DIM6/NTAB) family NADH-FMN oxidoreductase RutF
MNLVTYASPVALAPPVYAVGLYKGTQSWENWRASGKGLLQILRQQHAELVTLLGKTSARDVDKLGRLAALGFANVDLFGYHCLADCAGVMELQQLGDLVDAGDHEVALCSVGRMQNVVAEGEVLYTDFLRSGGYI